LIKIYNNPKGEAYRRLLDVAASHCSSFVLVERWQLKRDTAVQSVFEKLKPHLLKKIGTSESGEHRKLNIAYTQDAWLYFYDCNPQSIEILKSSADSLLDWQHPNLPEDLSFLDHDGNEWLVNIAHEEMMHLRISEEMAERLSREIQGLFLKGRFNQDLDRLLEDAVRHQAGQLEITGYGIRELPERLFDVHSLKSLSIFEQDVDHLPERLFELTGLEKLIVWTANLHNLPSAIKNLQQLRHLTIYCGCYNRAPEHGSIIKQEDVSFNRLPPEIGKLHNLEVLDIQYTALRDLPDTFKNLRNLRSLILRRNLFESKPRVLEEMKHVHVILD
jgi:Leucine-rich repeat (LRR) protein